MEMQKEVEDTDMSRVIRTAIGTMIQVSTEKSVQNRDLFLGFGFVVHELSLGSWKNHLATNALCHSRKAGKEDAETALIFGTSKDEGTGMPAICCCTGLYVRTCIGGLSPSVLWDEYGAFRDMGGASRRRN